jgi:hypothetical protein
MQCAIVKDAWIPDAWRVELIDMDSEGECYTAVFMGPDARERAHEYADWKRSECAQPG